MTKLAIAIEALHDIADGTGKVRVSDAMLVSKEAFREAFAPLLQKRAREAITEIEAIHE
jgi:hypothetical protein